MTNIPETNNLLSFWEEKPFWCQPWSILLTGIIALAISFVLLHRIWFTVLFSIIIIFWWILFLVIAPSAYDQQKEILKNIE